MALSERRKKVSEQLQALESFKIERAQQAAQNVIQSDQFKFSALAMPDASMAVDALVSTITKAVVDPVGEFIDTLRAKGFRQGEIRKLVHGLYNLYCKDPNDMSTKEQLYEDMIGPVAEYVCLHQELYNTFDPDSLRS